MKIIHKAIVGSRLHGLYNENSDYDYRGIFIHPLKDILNPYKKLKNTSWIEGDEDNTSYELMEFCKFATKGNPTILEILWSNQVMESTQYSDELIMNRHRFLDSKGIFTSHRGYAANQFKKMNLFTPDERTPKFAVAYIRALLQGVELLKHGDFIPQVDDEWKDYLMEVKYDWSPRLIPQLGKTFVELENKIANAYYGNESRFSPDFNWIQDFIYKVYIAESRK